MRTEQAMARVRSHLGPVDAEGLGTQAAGMAQVNRKEVFQQGWTRRMFGEVVEAATRLADTGRIGEKDLDRLLVPGRRWVGTDADMDCPAGKLARARAGEAWEALQGGGKQ